MKGTWRSDGSSHAPSLVFLAILAAAMLGPGAAAAAATAIVTAVITVGAVLALAVIAGAVLVVLRLRREHQAALLAPPALWREVPGAAPRELAPPAPRELHQHTHYHWHVGGSDDDHVAEIIRRTHRPEQ